MIGSVKGYNIEVITKKILEKGKLSFQELEKEDKEIIKEVEEIISNSGYVFALSKKKVLKSIYLFEFQSTDEGKNIIFKKSINLPEVASGLEEFENDIATLLGEELMNFENCKVVWGDKKIEPYKIKIGKWEIPVSLIWLSVGIIFWILFDSFIWFVVYFSIALSSGYAVKTNEAKRKLSKSKNKIVKNKKANKNKEK